MSDRPFRADRMVVHPDCAKDWVVSSIERLPDGSFEIRAWPRPIAPLRFAMEEEDAVAHLSRPSLDPDYQLQQHECVFYVEPEE